MEKTESEREGTVLVEEAAPQRPEAGSATARTATEPARKGQERQYHLDALRSTLMVLGVFLHASYLYATRTPWLVKDGDSSQLLLWMNESIHFFRIPCFFILSGFFSQMLLKKQGERPFLRSRLQRLALPLVSTAVLLNTLQAYYLHSDRNHTRGLAAFIASPAYADYWKSGEWIGHLWFLVNIMVYSLAAAALWIGWKRIKPHFMRAWARRRLPLPLLHRLLVRQGGFMLLLPLAQLFLFGAAAFLPFLYRLWGGLSGYGLLHFLPYYLFGLVLFLDRPLREEFQRVRPWQALSLPFALALGFFLDARFESKWAEAARFYIDSYLVWSCCALLFAAFRLLLNRKYRIFTYLSEASYSIYLFHHVCVVALGLFLSRKHWDVYLEFALIVGASLAVSVAAHHFLVLRIRALRLLFMGR